MNTFEDILKKINGHKKLDDEMLFCMINMIAEVYADDREIDEQQYHQLLVKLDKSWIYQQFEDVPSEQSFLAGGIWGCLRMMESIRRKKETEQKGKELAIKYETGTMHQVLQAIYNIPGLQNKELAEMCEVTPARISQITNNALLDGLITARSMGKEKSYYIRNLGEKVYKEIVGKRFKISCIRKTSLPDYKYICLSNKDGNFEMNWFKIGRSIKESNNIQVAIALVEQGESQNIPIRMTVGNVNAIYNEREKVLCASKMNDLSSNLENFLRQQKETGMTNWL